MRLHWPKQLNAAAFLAEYWQKKPLLIRQGLSWSFELTPELLAGMACEAEVESRLIQEDAPGQWRLRHGPFEEEDFLRLPEQNWTLLVQDVDKYLPEMRALLRLFHFIPSWRFDDVMVSYAVPGGSVGPHVDTYDVFLIQARGRREWRIDTQVADQRLREDMPLKILQHFETEHSWVLDPGDILYLPPGVAHWGIAKTDDCMTCSVGLRAPSLQEMIDSLAQYAIEQIPAECHYLDPLLTPQPHPARISLSTVQQVQAQLATWLNDPKRLCQWFGCFVTELKPHFSIAPAQTYLDASHLCQYLQQGGWLERHPFARLAWLAEDGQAWLFACGEAFPVPLALAGQLPVLCENDRLSHTDLQAWLEHAEGLALIVQLCKLGYWLQVKTDSAD